MTLVKLKQFRNAQIWIITTVSGMARVVSCSQFPNENPDMHVSWDPFSKMTLFSCRHLANTLIPRTVIDLGMVIDVREVQY